MEDGEVSTQFETLQIIITFVFALKIGHGVPRMHRHAKEWSLSIIAYSIYRQDRRTPDVDSTAIVLAGSSVHRLKYPIREINNLRLLDYSIQALDEGLMCRVLLDVVVSVCNRSELHDEGVGDSALSRS